LTAPETGIKAAGASPRRDWAKRLAGSNISQTSLLATDYLNHYNEVIMIVDMLPDMPEMLEDIEGWRPRSYAEHFRDCGFSYAELAIEAYEQAPAEFRRTFDDTRQKLDEMTLYAVRTLAGCVARNRAGELRERCAVFARAMQALTETMAATINGSATKADDDLIRSILGKG
jgi:hypothetical protein